MACTHLALALALASYAVSLLRRGKPGVCGFPLALALQRRFRTGAPMVLGFLTGLNLCPPFLAALLRAGSGTTLLQTMGFFLLFFVGTTPWFLPFLGTRALKPGPGLRHVARFVLLLLAAAYAYLGIVLLLERLTHGH